METRQKRTKILVSLLALAGLVVVSTFTMAGDLEPPGAPGSTMKTLDEVEPRIPISQGDIPLTINESGSYYLTEDINSIADYCTAINLEPFKNLRYDQGWVVRGAFKGAEELTKVEFSDPAEVKVASEMTTDI